MKIIKYTAIATILIVSLGLIYAAFVLSTGPANTLEILKTKQQNNSLGIDSTYNLPQYDSLVKQFAFKNALSALATDDSIQMAIHLGDSTVRLYIKGVSIFESKMSNLKKDKLLQSLRNDTYFGLFGSPIDVSNIRTTIIKEPIVEIEAPKNEDEATQNAYMPDTLIQFPAFLHLTLSNGVELFFDQDSVNTKEEKESRKIFIKEHKDIRRAHFMSSLTKGSKYYYEPSIQMELPINELRAIFRAVPRKIKVVLYIE